MEPSEREIAFQFLEVLTELSEAVQRIAHAIEVESLSDEQAQR